FIAKEPDEVGPETGARGFAYFGLIKVGRRGENRGLESSLNLSDIAEPCDAERHEMHYHAERGNENQRRTLRRQCHRDKKALLCAVAKGEA
ncbi:hypothetical protein, partial [Pseudomonas syringae]|uniref:hypothetical protein n=1 Tax=Pseudomonas syringae TaxID=317 RepID=UPI001F316009